MKRSRVKGFDAYYQNLLEVIIEEDFEYLCDYEYLTMKNDLFRDFRETLLGSFSEKGNPTRKTLEMLEILDESSDFKSSPYWVSGLIGREI